MLSGCHRQCLFLSSPLSFDTSFLALDVNVCLSVSVSPNLDLVDLPHLPDASEMPFMCFAFSSDSSSMVYSLILLKSGFLPSQRFLGVAFCLFCMFLRGSDIITPVLRHWCWAHSTHSPLFDQLLSVSHEFWVWGLGKWVFWKLRPEL